MTFRSNRRGILRGSAALALALGVNRAGSTEAANGPLVIGSVNNAGSDETELRASTMDQAATLRVRNLASSGLGVWGGSNGTGVMGASESGTGVAGVGAIGVEARAQSDDAFGARKSRALVVLGRAAFSSAGSVIVPSGARSVRVSGLAVPDGALLLALCQEQRGVFVTAARRIGAGAIRIHLNRPARTAVRVAYFFLEAS